MAEKDLVRTAVIDLGTNTFNLLVANVSSTALDIVHSEKLPVMLGMGGINRGVIADAAMSRAKDALKRFKEKCIGLGVSDIRGIGTSALRAASNAKTLLEYAEQNLGIKIKIVSGNDEAELIFRGVALTHDFLEPAMIMDIGGGSTEFILANDTGVNWAQSYEIGVSRIFQQLDQPEEYSASHMERIGSILDSSIGDHLNRRANVLIGASGSFETFYEMTMQQPFPQEGKTIEIPYQKLMDVVQWSITATLEERMANDWIVPMRKKMLPVAAAKVKWVLEKLEANTVLVSPYSLKEGAFSRV